MKALGVTIRTENSTSITSTTQTYNILQHYKAKHTIFNNGHFTTHIPTDPHTVTTTYIKTNMRHIRTSIVSRHLTTRDNNWRHLGSQYEQKTQHPSHPLHKHTTYFNTPRLNTLSSTTAVSQQTFPQTPTQSLQHI